MSTQTEMMLRQALVAMTDRASEELSKRKQAETQRYEAFMQLRQFKDLVRDTTISARDANDFCLAGTNEFLEALGLDRIAVSYTVSGTVSIDCEMELTGDGMAMDYVLTATVPFTVNVDAGDEDDARELVENMDSDDMDLQWSSADYEADNDAVYLSDEDTVAEHFRWSTTETQDIVVDDVVENF